MALATGEIFPGVCFGHEEPVTGEVVFNTSLTGYQEILSDPSYRRQLVCMTAPHIGIVGANELDMEAGKPQAAGMIVRELSLTASNWRAKETLVEHFERHKVTGITGIDTRRLTRLLRDQGAVNGCIAPGTDAELALKLAQECPPIEGDGLGETAGRDTQTPWNEGAWDAGSDILETTSGDGPSVAVLDCGAKNAIMRELASHGMNVCAVPYDTDTKTLTANFSGVVFSNGPGDPMPLAKAIDLARELLDEKMPLLGICLGHQVLALAAGAKTIKMKFGHHGANHPVVDRNTGVVLISSQNHGFAVDPENLPSDLEITHTSLFDGSIQGFRHRERPAIGFQGHPEASPGPRELTSLFDSFKELVAKHA